jgi:hypothetical protein
MKELRKEAAHRQISIETLIELLWTKEKLRRRQTSPMLERPIALWTQAEEKEVQRVGKKFVEEDRH